MCASAATSSICYLLPAAMRPTYATTLVVTVAVSTVCWVTVTLLTRPVDLEHLVRFFERVSPPGAWGPVRARALPATAPTNAREATRQWLASTVAILSATLLPGALLFGRTATSIALAAALALALIVACRPKISEIVARGRRDTLRPAPCPDSAEVDLVDAQRLPG